MLSNLGRVGRDAELRTTASGVSVFTVPVAYEYGVKLEDGKRPTQWVDLTFWAKQAETFAPLLKSGQQIFFSADDVHVETFVGKDQSTKYKLAGRAATVKLAGGNGKGESTPEQSQQGTSGPDQSPLQDDDIPFAPVHYLA
jgi:single-strand DNA-binding protein